MAQIQREGRVVFGDASISIWEEGLGGSYQERQDWEKAFKKQVFTRMIQQLNRMGWTCELPPFDQAEKDRYTRVYEECRRTRRHCHKGELKGYISVSGRHIEFKMWQSVNTPNRADHGGQYEPNKEAVMPYVLRIRMEWTRRRLRDYLCNVFSGYVFDQKGGNARSQDRGPGKLTAIEWMQGVWAEDWYAKGVTLEFLPPEKLVDHNSKSVDGGKIEHGKRVWFEDWHGRIGTGIAYYNGGSMWWVITGKYSSTNKSSHELYTQCPENPRVKRNDRLRRKRLEQELANAIKAMNFERAAKLRDIVYPPGEALFMVWSKSNEAYHRTNWQGYTTDQVDAGKFTREELGRFANDDQQKVIAVA